MARTYLVTGSASGICAAAAQLLEGGGARVIGADLRNADIEADLGTPEGRRHLVAAATRLAPGGLDGVLAGAGISRPDKAADTISVNYFGAVATLEGLRPLLARSQRPRAVAICSTAAMLPPDEPTLAACEAGDEARARAEIAQRPMNCYGTSKRALAHWLRRTATLPDWAGQGILLNGVGPGVVHTPMSAPLFADPDMVALIRQTNPIAVQGYAQAGEIAELLGYLLDFSGHYLLGQIIYIDGGTDALLRPRQF